MTKQEIYDKVKAHLLAQGKQSVASSGTCLYRGPNGTKCAAGALIDDEHYSSSFERSIVSRDVNESLCDALVASGVAEKDLPFVRLLQRIHDAGRVDEWRKRLKLAALKEGLNP